MHPPDPEKDSGSIDGLTEYLKQVNYIKIYVKNVDPWGSNGLQSTVLHKMMSKKKKPTRMKKGLNLTEVQI